MEPDGTVLRAKGRDTKGLSGGEKSFSTICLLLSMWEGKQLVKPIDLLFGQLTPLTAMGAPIRCLDELYVALCLYSSPTLMNSSDVFMDSVNRDVSMEMMVRPSSYCMCSDRRG